MRWAWWGGHERMAAASSALLNSWRQVVLEAQSARPLLQHVEQPPPPHPTPQPAHPPGARWCRQASQPMRLPGQ